jgi:putative SOS response-associated peptidase YedK
VCGRFTLTSTPELLARRFGLEEPPTRLVPRFNIAPSQDVATIRAGEDGTRVLELRRWGLVPGWARDPKIGNRMINARCETVSEKPAFREAYRHRRCLVPADGFYEWAAGKSPRQPYHIGLAEGGPFAIAALWECWSPDGADRIDSCTLLTTRANARLRGLHDRMPVILDPADHGLWLDPGVRGGESLRALLRPLADERIAFRPVSRHVNDPRHDDPDCVAPVATL